MSDPLRFGSSESVTQPWGFREDVERSVALGVDTIEVVKAKLDADPDRAAEQMVPIADAGLGIGDAQPVVRTFFASRTTPPPSGLDECVAALRGSVDRLRRLAPGVAFTTKAGAHPEGDIAESIRVVGGLPGELARVAADDGVTLAIEPLNPISVDVEDAIWTTGRGSEIIDLAGGDPVGPCLAYRTIRRDDEAQTARARAVAASFHDTDLAGVTRRSRVGTKAAWTEAQE